MTMELLHTTDLCRRVGASELLLLPEREAEERCAKRQKIYFSSMKCRDGSQLHIYAREVFSLVGADDT